MTKPPARAGLIGCGRIGSLLDEASLGPQSLTHAAALARSPRVSFEAVCDVDIDRARACAKERGVRSWYASFPDMLREVPLDLLVIATPPTDRLQIVEAAAGAGIRLVWCEKPVAASIEEVHALRDLVVDAEIIFGVNHLRRWSPLFTQLRDNLDGAASVQHISGTYTTGLANGGSHLIDLIVGLFGLPARVQWLGTVNDGRAGGADPTYHFAMWLISEGREIPIAILGSDHSQFTIFEMTCVAADRVVKVTDLGRGLAIETVRPDPDFHGYRSPREIDRREGCLFGMFDRALDQLLDAYEGDGVPLCGIDDAVKVMSVVDAVRLSAHTGTAVDVSANTQRQ